VSTGKAGAKCSGAEPVVSDHYQGLKTAIRAVLPEVVWQRRGMRKQPTLW